MRCRRKVLCFQRLAYGAEEQEGEWTGKRIPAQHTSFLSDESCVGKKKKRTAELLLAGDTSLEGICKSALLHALESFIFPID